MYFGLHVEIRREAVKKYKKTRGVGSACGGRGRSGDTHLGPFDVAAAARPLRHIVSSAHHV